MQDAYKEVHLCTWHLCVCTITFWLIFNDLLSKNTQETHFWTIVLGMLALVATYWYYYVTIWIFVSPPYFWDSGNILEISVILVLTFDIPNFDKFRPHSFHAYLWDSSSKV